MHTLSVAGTRDKLRQRITGAWRNGAWQLGFNRQVFEKATGTRVLVYHGICFSDHLRYNTLFLTIKAFESQLRLYKKYFQVVTLDDLYNGNFDDRRFTISITFDDGFSNNYRFVLPLLEAYEIPATFFITGIREAGYDVLWNDVLAMANRHGPADFVFRDELFARDPSMKYRSTSTGRLLAEELREQNFDAKAEMIDLLGSYRYHANRSYWQQMTTEEIRALAQSKWAAIGSHGYYHNDLAKLPTGEAALEMHRSKTFLESITGRPVKAMAYPYGSYTNELNKAAVECGYSWLLATGFAHQDDKTGKHLKDRLTTNPFVSTFNQLYASIIGKYD
jgi:peptidoglycan/xylan/chitin deacetylase (PgdA/CDA1 family)